MEFVALSGLINHLESERCGLWRFQGGNNLGMGLGYVSQLRIGM